MSPAAPGGAFHFPEEGRNQVWFYRLLQGAMMGTGLQLIYQGVTRM